MTRFLPGLAVLLMTLLCALPWGMPETTGPSTSFSVAIPIAVVFAFGFWWPDRLPTWIGFLAGLLSDAVTGGPLGYWALLYLLALTVARACHAAIRVPGLPAAWGGFAVTAALLSVVAWTVTSLYRLELVAWWPVSWPFLGLAVSFPCIAALVALLKRWSEGRRPLGNAASE
jgi:rod shape-determining protein MreD